MISPEVAVADDVAVSWKHSMALNIALDFDVFAVDASCAVREDLSLERNDHDFDSMHLMTFEMTMMKM